MSSIDSITFSSFYAALVFRTPQCCDCGHAEFNIADYFPGLLSTSREPAILDEEKQKKPRMRYRAKIDRDELEKRLQNWRKVAHSNDPILCSWPPTYILHDDALILLARAKAGSFKTPTEIGTFLEETDEWIDAWGDRVLNIISQYDLELKVAKDARVKAARAAKRAAKAAQALEDKIVDVESEDEDGDELSAPHSDDSHSEDDPGQVLDTADDESGQAVNNELQLDLDQNTLAFLSAQSSPSSSSSSNCGAVSREPSPLPILINMSSTSSRRRQRSASNPETTQVASSSATATLATIRPAKRVRETEVRGPMRESTNTYNTRSRGRLTQS